MNGGLSPSALRLSLACGILAVVVAAVGTPASVRGAEQCAAGSVADILQSRLESAKVAAGALVVVHDGRVEFSGGFASQGDGTIDPEQTVFRAASNGKPIVAAAVMQLAAEGRIDLHADINTYLNAFKVPAAFGEPVTLDAILTHSAGFDDHFLGALAKDPDALVALGPYLADHLPSRVVPPGQQIVYSNHAMALAAYVVEAVTGEDFADYAQRHVFAPLGMSSSSFRQPPPASIARRQINTRAGMAPYLNPYPAGSLVATPMDVGRFVASQLGTPLEGSAVLMPEAARQLMLDQHFTPNLAMPGAAYGYFESDANGHRSLHHTGDGGDHSLLYLVPDARFGFFLVYTAPRQGDTSTPREQIAQDLIDHYLGCREPFAQPEPPPDFASRADRYVGTYRVEPFAHATIEKLAALGQEITVTNPGDGTLGAELGDGAPIRLVESGPNLFRDPDGAYVAFRADATGRITSLSFSGAAVDDPGSAERIGWFETANANLIFILLGASLVLVRVVAEVAVRLSGRRIARPAATMAWRLSGWIVIILILAVLLSIGSLVTSGGVITGIPIGVGVAILLVNVVAVLAVLLLPAVASDLRRRRGHALQRVVLVMAAAVAILALPFLAYWNLIGIHI